LSEVGDGVCGIKRLGEQRHASEKEGFMVELQEDLLREKVDQEV
jgi:hypothetical protein